MGVRGLTTYVEGNRQFFQDVKLRDTRLVIDGCSLFFRLYFNHGLDQQHGGDYDAFSRLLSQFLSALSACSIQPFVVLDGGMDPSDKKFTTLKQRLQSKIKMADSLANGRHGSVLPLLTEHVFIQVLSQQGVPLVQCTAEADWEIACLANQWGCPVLTNDSDFYIFDLPGGYLPFPFFQWTDVGGDGPARFIQARRYTVDRLCTRFGAMNRQLLPLFAVLAGNDYQAPVGMATLLSLLDLTAAGGGGGGGRGGRGRKTPPSLIEGLLLWLASFPGVEEALEEVGRVMGGGGGGRGRRGRGGGARGTGGGGERKELGGLGALLWTAMQEYQLTPDSPLARWFSGGPVAPLAGQTAVSPPDPSPVPEWLSQAVRRAGLTSVVLDVLVLRRVLLMPQVENSRLPSSHCSARALRQAFYGILLQGAGARRGERGKRAQGGSDRGGSARGGSAQGGSARGGSAQGGSAQGGSAQGGRAQGGSAQGGSAQGGSAQGGSAQGGSAQGGSAQGGSAQGGSAQGVEGPRGGVKEAPGQGKDVREQEVSGQGTRGRGRGGRGREGGSSGGLGMEEEGIAGEEGAASAPVCVEEYDRQDLTLRRSEVDAQPPRTQLDLDTLDKAPLQVRLGVLLDALGVTEAALTPLPPHFRLAVAVTCFWMREARPVPSAAQLQALLLGMVHGELARSTLPGAGQTEWAAEAGAGAGLDRLRAWPGGGGRGLDVGGAHAFSQWQSCLLSALHLNRLLALPLPEPHVAWLFSGTLVHGLARCVAGDRPAQSLLGGAPLSGQLYLSLLAGVRNHDTGTSVPPSSSSGRGRKRGSRRGRRGRGGRGGGGGERGSPAQGVNNRFALLGEEEEEDEE